MGFGKQRLTAKKKGVPVIGSPLHKTTDSLGRPWMATSCGIFRSDDDGLTWKLITDVPENADVTSLRFGKANEVLLGTTQGLFRSKRISSVSENRLTNMANNAKLNLLTTPNPVSKSADVSFDIPYRSDILVEIFNSLGVRVDIIADDMFEKGHHTVHWNVPEFLSDGMYSLMVTTNNSTNSRMVMVHKQ